jgi:hypothetical protein
MKSLMKTEISMNGISRISRREALAIVSILPCRATASIESNPFSDARLLLLGRAFDEVITKLDRAADGRYDVEDEWLEELDRIEVEILKTQAVTIDGFRVKARAACWALLGDLNSVSEETTDQRMAISTIRDLIRGYDPQLERPGAVKQLVEEIEMGADRPSNT